MANFNFKSPSVKFQELDRSFASTPSLGITSVGIVGETLKGPAFSPILVTDKSEFRRYFGGTSTEKYADGSGRMKYLAPTYAYSFLEEGNQLYFTRILGKSGYNAGRAWAITISSATAAYDNMVVAILRSRGSGSQDNANFNITSVTGTFHTTSGSPLSNFTLTAVGASVTENLQFNLDVTSSNYVGKAMGFKNSDTKSNLWVEAVYSDLIRKISNESKIYEIKSILALTSSTFSAYKAQYTNPETPWLVSELNGSSVSRLFKFISYSDGDAANREVKIAIENINPTTKEFDVVVRDFADSDTNPSILERFGRCTMNPADNNFIMRKIGGVYSDADSTFLEDARSVYVYVNVNVNAPITSIPCGFEGYQLRSYVSGGTSAAVTPVITYKTGYTSTDKVLKTYLGISEKAYDSNTGTKGLSINPDLFKYIGATATANSLYKTKGFHLDSGATGTYTDSQGNVIGQFTVGAGPISNTASVATGTYYADLTKRKFVVVPAGGFDGWDVNYEVLGGRSNSASFAQGGVSAFTNSDYDAYKEAYQIYEDTERTPINLFATPGINWQNNTELVKDALEIIEEIRQDALYIIDAPDANLNDTPTVVANSYVDDLDTAEIDSSYAASYVPYIRRKDADSNTNIFIPPTGEVLKAMALSDRTSFIWFATAGLNRGGLPNAKDVRKTFKESDRDTLYLGRLNPIVKFSNNTPGVFVYGQKTLQVADSKLDRIDVRRLLLYAKQIISAQARLYLFEPNDDVLATNFIAESNKKLKVIQDNRGLQTFKVRLDNTLNTPESRDRNEIYFVIDLLPIGAVEFIGLTFVVNKSTSSIQFNG